MWCTGLVALRHVGSSWTRDRTRVPCIGRQILNQCATREAPVDISYMSNTFCTFLTTRVPCIGRRILNQCATREAPVDISYMSNTFCTFLTIFFKLIYLATLGLHCCARAFSSCGEQGLLFVVVCGLLIAVFSCCGAWALGMRASVVVAHGL